MSTWASTCFKLLKFESILKLNKTRCKQTYTKSAEPNFSMHSNFPTRITTDVNLTMAIFSHVDLKQMNLPHTNRNFSSSDISRPTHQCCKNAPRSLGYGALGSSVYVYILWINTWQSNSIFIGNIPAIYKTRKICEHEITHTSWIKLEKCPANFTAHNPCTTCIILPCQAYFFLVNAPFIWVHACLIKAIAWKSDLSNLSFRSLVTLSHARR